MVACIRALQYDYPSICWQTLFSLSAWENTCFILGANGASKSNLMQRLYRPHFANTMDIGTSLVFFQRNDFITTEAETF